MNALDYILAASGSFVQKLPPPKRPAPGTEVNWTAVLLYCFAAGACYWAMAKEKLAQLRTYTPRVWRFWLVMGALLTLLSFSRMVGLGEWLDNLGRQVLRSADAYEDRRPMQALLIVLAVLLGLAALTGAVWFARKALRAYLAPIAAAVVLITFVIVKMISLHHVDHFLGDNHALGVSLGGWLEAIPILIIGACAGYAVYRDYRPRMRAYETRVRIR